MILSKTNMTKKEHPYILCNLLVLSEITVLPRVLSVALMVHAKLWCISSLLLTLSQKFHFSSGTHQWSSSGIYGQFYQCL